MKTAIIIVLAATLCGCCPAVPAPSCNGMPATESPASRWECIHYNGHYYLVYNDPMDSSKTILHNPDCPCAKSQAAESPR